MRLFTNKRLTIFVGLSLVGIGYLFADYALAHEMQPALLNLKAIDSNLWQVEFRQPQVQGRFLNLKLKTNCEASPAEPVVAATVLVEVFQLHCSDALASIAIAGIERSLIDAVVTIHSLDGSKRTELLTATRPRVAVSGEGQYIPVYLLLGIEHLLFGTDHVLFVLLLLYLVKGWSNLVKVITSFTLAHSITLGLSAYHVLSVSQSPVEILIALSIVLIAYEAIYPNNSMLKRQPWLLVFVFGLLHGLGFAGALKSIGLPDENAIAALFLFNVGIEMGQLAIVAVVLGIRQMLPARSVNWLLSYANLVIYLAGGVAVFWLLDRTVQFWLTAVF